MMLKFPVLGIILAFTLVGARSNSTHLVTTRNSTSITSQSNLNSNTTSTRPPPIIATAPFHLPSPTIKGGGGGNTQGPPGTNTAPGTPGGSFPGQSVTINETPDPTTTIKPFQGSKKLTPGRTKSNTLSELPIFQASPLTPQDAAETLVPSTARKTSTEQLSAETVIQSQSTPVTGAHIVSLSPTSSTSSTSSESTSSTPKPADTTARYSTSSLSVSPTSAPNSTLTPVSPTPALSQKHLDTRSIIGYVIGSLLLLLAVAVALYIYFRMRQGKSLGTSQKHAMETQNKQPYSSLIDRSSMLGPDIHNSRPTSRVPSTTHRSSPGLTWIRDSRGSTSVGHGDRHLEKLDRHENLAITDSSRIALLECAATEIMRAPRAKGRSSDQSSFTKASSSFFGEEDFPFREIPI